MRPIPLLLASSLLLFALPASAEEVPGLYQVRQSVTSQADEERNQVMAEALKVLAVRLTGDPKAADDQRLQPLLGNAAVLVQQYVYEAGKPLDLDIRFDPKLVEKALANAGLTLWSADRPQVLTWWLSDTAAGTYLVGDSDERHAAALREAARRRGLPLALPMGELNEQSLRRQELLAQQPGELASLSARYAADVTLAVVEGMSSTGHQADWVLWLGNQALSGNVSAASSGALADAVFLAVAAELSSHLTDTGSAGEASTLVLEVDGVTLQNYSSLQRLLAPFNPRLVGVAGQQQRYVLQASPARLRAQLALGRLQEQTEDPLADTTGTPVLRFSW